MQATSQGVGRWVPRNGVQRVNGWVGKLNTSYITLPQLVDHCFSMYLMLIMQDMHSRNDAGEKKKGAPQDAIHR